MDFSGWFEAYLDGRWYTFDARHNVPRIGRVLMARGRDAVDVALTTSFGTTRLETFAVWTDEVSGRELDEVQERRSPVGWNATSQV
jgi:transglutaminase-like putative cysteine protease